MCRIDTRWGRTAVGMWSAAVRVCAQVGERACGIATAMVVALGFVVLLPGLAQATAPTLPTTGVDVGAHISVLITSLGAVVLIAIGGFFAYRLVRFGLRWVRTSV